MQLSVLLLGILPPALSSLEDPLLLTTVSNPVHTSIQLDMPTSSDTFASWHLTLGPGPVVTNGVNATIVSVSSDANSNASTSTTTSVTAESSTASPGSSTGAAVVVGGSGLGLVGALAWAVGVMMV